jgi:iron-sulfur cluster repair protein YtfE (RIC family)
VRTSVLAQHEHLRRTLAAATNAARHVLAGGRAEEAGLQSVVSELTAELAAHIVLENEHLVPAIREADAWGPQRAERVLREHDSQLATLARLSAAVPGAPSAELARAALDLVADILADMHREEDELLRPEFLRDDVIAIEQFDG